jgi:hypothetical protein
MAHKLIFHKKIIKIKTKRKCIEVFLTTAEILKEC